MNFRQQLDSFEWQFNYANYYQSLPSVHRHRPPFPQLQPAEDRAAGTQLDGSEVMTCVTQRGGKPAPLPIEFVISAWRIGSDCGVAIPEDGAEA